MKKHYSFLQVFFIISFLETSLVAMEDKLSQVTQKLEAAATACNTMARLPFSPLKGHMCGLIGVGKQDLKDIQEASKNLSAMQKSEAKKIAHQLVNSQQGKSFFPPAVQCKYDKKEGYTCKLDKKEKDEFTRNSVFLANTILQNVNNCLQNPDNEVTTCQALGLYTAHKFLKEWEKQNK